jgi:hypothetical protein
VNTTVRYSACRNPHHSATTASGRSAEEFVVIDAEHGHFVGHRDAGPGLQAM